MNNKSFLKNCKGNKKMNCYKCRNTRFLDPIPSHYTLRACFKSMPPQRNVAQEACYKNLAKLLKDTNLYYPDDSVQVNPHFKVYTGAPQIEKPVFKTNRSGKPTKIQDNEQIVDSNFKAYSLVTDSVRIDAAEDILHNYAKPYYVNTKISSLKMNKAGNLYIASLQGEGRNYCLKRKCDHQNNRVYMKIKHDKRANMYKVCMGCHDAECNQPEKWESNEVTLSMLNRKLFFPPNLEKSNTMTFRDSLIVHSKKQKL